MPEYTISRKTFEDKTKIIWTTFRVWDYPTDFHQEVVLSTQTVLK